MKNATAIRGSIIIILVVVLMVFSFRIQRLEAANEILIEVFNDLNMSVDLHNKDLALLSDIAQNTTECIENIYETISTQLFSLTITEVEEIAKVIETEAGSAWLSDEHQQAVASVVFNRINSIEFPNTVHDVIHQDGQYSKANTAAWNDIEVSERAVRNVLYVLKNGSTLPISVVFQGNNKQGSGVYKEILCPKGILNTTYFCYSSNMELYGNEKR